MKIRKITCFAVVVPPKMDALYRIDKEVDIAKQKRAYAGIKWIVIIETEDGYKGIGESHRNARRESIEESAHALMGQDVLKINLQKLPLPPGRGYECFEIALYDIVGKLQSQSVSELLGERYRSDIAVHYWMGKRNVEDSIDVAKRAVGAQFNAIKIKCGHDAPDQDTLIRVEAVSRVMGENCKILLDANGGFQNRADLDALLENLAPYNVVAIEDPFPKDCFLEFAELRAKSPVPIMYHAITEAQARDAILHEACDYMNVGSDGLAESVRMFALAAKAEIKTMHGSAMELGVRDVAYMQTLACAETAVLPSDILHFLWEHDLLKEPLMRVDGVYTLPQGAGLGIDLDMDAVNRYKVDEFILT